MERELRPKGYTKMRRKRDSSTCLRNDAVVDLTSVPHLLLGLAAAPSDEAATARLGSQRRLGLRAGGFVGSLVADGQRGGAGAGLAILAGGADVGAGAALQRRLVVCVVQQDTR